MEYLEKEYQRVVSTPSDIVDHIPMLRALASQCKHVTEFGVRTGVSTRAFLAETVTLRAYDIYIDPDVELLFNIARGDYGRDVKYIKGNTLALDIEETDLLFIDTDHTYTQLSTELGLHAHKVHKFLVMHDTGEPYAVALLPAIMEFLATHPEWRVRYHSTACHGLTVLERINKQYTY